MNNPFAKTARVAVTSSLVAASLATAGLVLSPLAQADYSDLSATTDVNVRTSPDTNGEIVAVLSAGDTVTQRGVEQDGWLPIIYNGTNAWVQAQYVSSTTVITTDTTVGSATTTADAYVRSDADPTSWIMGTLSEGTTVSITGDPVGEWTPVNYYGRAGWIATSLLADAGDGSAGTITSAISQDYLWVRTGTSTAFTSIGMLYPGDEVTVTGTPFAGWVPVDFNGQDAWVAANYSRYVTDPTTIALVASTTSTEDAEAPAEEPAAPAEEEAAPAQEVAPAEEPPVEQAPAQESTPATTTKWAADDVNVRTGPGLDYSVVDVLDQGDTIEATGVTNGDWTEIIYGGVSRWVNSAYVSDTEVAPYDETENAAPTQPEAVSHSSADAVQTAIDFAYSKLGGPYVWGGTGPVGYDCSGLMQAAYAAAGISIPRVTWDQVNAGTPVYSTDDLRPGDLVFYYDNGHVGMYIGDGLVLNAQNESTGIVISGLYDMAPISAMVRIVG
ncbi:C40 family peptidase [Propionibacterium australiense]|uniref:Bacterial SH3 domain n=1 Tax=Propionibacterium australiense TaxID=119981 RepID=A0A383S5I5_9ACTN|nr:C40 family peptidase [Propionibacterium australiense]RLP11995.1 peptidoglycan endopeptidase [Propionibacterium australiense]RLP12632.1 peptidoglycan endopeptidase [Propionibacterium australiense]SYZ32536.1 Bacterial SH3 domain [Propionibacterium australiense]VEH91713.1 Probable endopeptidase cgR_2070 precursor [Propionibacterium australiense]